MKPQATPNIRPFVEVRDYEGALDWGRKHANKRPYNPEPDRLDAIKAAEERKKHG